MLKLWRRFFRKKEISYFAQIMMVNNSILEGDTRWKRFKE